MKHATYYPYYNVTLGTCLAVFLLTLATMATLYAFNSPAYVRILREDGPIEWATAVLFVGAGVTSLYAAWITEQKGARLFFVTFALFSIALGLEEISWGQRIIGFESGELFTAINSQQETNIHNTLEKMMKETDFYIYTTRQMAAMILGTYGVILPLLTSKSLIAKGIIAVPPLGLVPVFLTASLFAWLDWPMGIEEEIGEFFFALAFFYLPVLWILRSCYR